MFVALTQLQIRLQYEMLPFLAIIAENLIQVLPKLQANATLMLCMYLQSAVLNLSSSLFDEVFFAFQIIFLRLEYNLKI